MQYQVDAAPVATETVTLPNHYIEQPDGK